MLSMGIRALAAFITGWLLYMIGMILTTYDGLLSLIFQPLIGAVVSGIVVVVALLAGLLLRVSPFRRWWHGRRLWAMIIAGLSLFVLCFGYSLGLTWVATHPETGAKIEMLHPTAAILGYFALIFAVTNWPVRRKATGLA